MRRLPRFLLPIALMIVLSLGASAQDAPIYQRGYTVTENTMPPSPEPASVTSPAGLSTGYEYDPDPLSEKYYGISPYLSATYYTLENDASLIENINEAIGYFNNASEYKYIFKGKEYKVVFYLKNEPTTKNVLDGSINSSGNNQIIKTDQSLMKEGEKDLKRKIILMK